MTKYTLRNASPAKTRAEAVVVGILSTKDGPAAAPGCDDVAQAYARGWRGLLSSLGVTGKAGEVTRVPTGKTINAPVLVLVGLGVFDDSALPRQVAVRRAAGVAARSIPNATSVAVALPAETPELIAAVTEGLILGSYSFTRYKKKSDAKAPADVIVLSPAARKAEAISAFEQAQIVAECVTTARDWVNTAPADLTPPLFAEAVAAAHKELTQGRGAPKVALEVLDDEQLAELGCGGILSVGNSSVAKPRLVKLTWSPKNATTHLALVGKGVTFDSGGLSIKPGGSMVAMKGDMAGAAAVIATVFAVAKLGLPVKITAFAPMAENMISGSSSRPGDIVTTHSGKTVELANTDAEGRMLLIDALSMAVEEQPDLIVDIATLTGHMQLALGDKVGAVMGTDDVVADVLSAGARAGEQQWAMPIPEEMKERITASRIADLLQHDWTRWGGGLFAAAFLREFTNELPWAHLDIAGKEINSGGPYGHVTSGATGFGVTTLVELVRGLAETD